MDLADDPVWTERFERAREYVETHTDPLDVFHIGSTAIPDLAGKPELDVLGVYEDVDAVRAAGDALVAGGDEWERTDADDVVVVYRRDPPAGEFLRLHTVADDAVRQQLAVREYLRADADARRRYERVKRSAADEHDEFESYQSAKRATVETLLAEAREAGHFERLPASVRRDG
ncbi:GrpB family protein [Halobaculum sp. MBLA0147]|uniref:GrpB family protein n=1 Tax=Halobaculum sp. MBLA0147 TaxID=3079934 RepID=UPI00352401AB